MRRGHRRPAKNRVSIIRGIITGTSARAWGGDIGLYPVTPIDYYWAAAAKGSNVVTPGYESADSVRGRVDGWRIHHRGTVGTVVASARHHHDPGSGLGLHSSLQCISRTAFRRRADPGVTRNIRSPERVALPAADR